MVRLSAKAASFETRKENKMEPNQGSCERKPARYQVLLDRAGKAISELGTVTAMLEQSLDVVLEQGAPTCDGPVEKEKALPGCKLDDELLNLCCAIETRLVGVQNINSRIRL